jgi:surface antigen
MHMARPAPFFIAAVVAAAWAATASAGSARPDFYVGYSGTHWQQDYDVMSGHCNRQAIGASFAIPAGEMIGPRTAGRDNRAAATLIGASVDGLVAPKIGRELDEGDRACVGHALEIGKPGHRVSWDNAATGVHYDLTPDEGHNEIAGMCRGFKLVAHGSTGHSKRRGTACQKGPGLWQLTSL